MKHHNLKSFTKQFQHVVDGKKRSEIRFDDRQYEIGDVVRAPAPYPLELAQRCIESVGHGPVLDPFLGSGTTAVAAEMLGVEWIGIEKSPAYVEYANERIQKLKRK